MPPSNFSDYIAMNLYGNSINQSISDSNTSYNAFGSEPVSEKLGSCDDCGKLDGEELIQHFITIHPNFYQLILTMERVIQAKKEIELDGKKPEIIANRLDSIEE